MNHHMNPSSYKHSDPLLTIFNLSLLLIIKKPQNLFFLEYSLVAYAEIRAGGKPPIAFRGKPVAMISPATTV